nr:MAG TPA: hypothetical protein [Caudoviricetes sp.]
MKVRQFLNKMLYASSTIKHIYVVQGTQKTELFGVASDPMATDSAYEDQLNARLISFRIANDKLTIYSSK